MLWAYRTTCKKLTGHTPFRLAYGQEDVMPMEYIIPSLKIAVLTDMAEEETVSEIVVNLVELEEDRFIAGFHQQI